MSLAHLSRERRVEIAKKAIAVRYAQFPRVTHAGVLHLGNRNMECGVLDNRKRILKQGEVFKAFEREQRGKRKFEGNLKDIPSFLEAENLVEYIKPELQESLKSISYKDGKGKLSQGYDAQILPRICWVYIDAAKEGKLVESQKHLFEIANIVLRAFSTIGIYALIDEASGYQKERENDALAQIMNMFISKELREWSKEFNLEYYQEMARLRNYPIPTDHRTGHVYAKIINHTVYSRIAPFVLQELKKKRSETRTKSGHYKSKLHQSLTEDMGVRALRDQISAVTTLAKISENYEEFTKYLDKAHPAFPENVDELKEMPHFDLKCSAF